MADGRVIIEAILDTINVSKNVKNLSSQLDGISWKNIAEGDKKAQDLSNAFKSAGTACTLSLTTPIAAAGVAAFKVAGEYESATSRIQAAFGVTREEAERFSGIGKTIYENGWGTSLDEVNDALIQCKSTLRDVSDEDLQTVTTNALMLSQTFGADVNESIRGVNALMHGFGLSADEATDLMTAGMQRGLNYTDELGDNLSEYSVRWGEAGMTASQYFSLLEAGTSNGAYNLDKVGDYLNEFLTSLSDGRMEESIGQFSEGTQEVFENFKSGGATAEDVLQAVLGDLSQMPNEYDRAAIASTLWSSLGEDNAMGMIMSLAGVTDTFGDVEGAAQNAADATSDSFANKAEVAVRTLQGSLDSFGEPLVNIASMVADIAAAFGNWLSSLPAPAQQAVFIIGAILAAIGPVLSIIGKVISIAPSIVSAIGTVRTAFTGLNAIMAANPIGIIITAIGLLVAAFIYLWNTSEEFRNFWIGLWDSICAIIAPIAEWINTNVIQPIIEFFTGLFTNIQTIWNAIVEAVTICLNTIWTVISTVLGVISTIWNTIWTAISTVASTIWAVISSVIGTAISVISTVISTVLNTIFSIWSTIWNTVWSVASSIWNGISSTIGGIINAISSTISSVFNTISSIISSVWGAISGTTSDIWNGIKSTISGVIDGAKNIVSGGLDAISGFFSGLNLSFPHINLPHFTISGEFSLDPPSIPSFGIEWYAKGGVFNGATIAGIGEAGPEMALPLNQRSISPFANAIAEAMPNNQGAVVYQFGDINLDMSDLQDLATLEDFVNLILAAKRANPTRAGR